MKIKKIILILFFLIISQKAKTQKVEQKQKFEDTTPSIEDEVFSKQTLLSYIKELGIKYPNIVLRQAIHESGYFKSNIFKENNNLFGMRKPGQRKTTAVGKNRGYAVYNTWKDSVVDYLLFQERFISKIGTQNEYLNYLNRNYSGVGHLYSKRLMSISL